ncbi:peroxidase family protein [Synechococcus sp. PCC 7336]|uniref:peroxidase family protein n=1 Tax=Synechococcus sp. PCC 7336 TaxID=195250 RepID=UPI000346208D|nr:peroxidase family protein [Synechococcus sp. PCC 7336]
MGEFRTINGLGNNIANPTLGEAETELIRLFDPAFEDGISVPRGGEFDSSTLPNPRTISNIVVEQEGSIPNFLSASNWLWQWGQFLDHDLDLNEASGASPAEDFTPIPVPQDDLSDPFVQDGITELPFIRVPAAEGTGETTPRENINEITHFIDGSNVYGSEDERAEALRAGSGGLLATSAGPDGEVFLPLNDADNPIANANALGFPDEILFVAGDIRANEQTGLTAVHTLFVREHNRFAGELAERLDAGEAALAEKYDEFLASTDLVGEEALDEFLYQSTRKVIGAQLQLITYQEFLPLLIGENLLDSYEGYDPTVDPSVSQEFANAVFRLGHTLLTDTLLRVDGEGVSSATLAASFFNPFEINADGVDSLLTGLTLQTAEELDNMIVDGVRNFLFPGATGGLDLASVNIARGREVGLPSYTEVYNQLFPDAPIESFDDLPFSAEVRALFEAAYDSVGQIDLWIGGISELTAGGNQLLGPTFDAILTDQFVRLRDGDRFFFLDEGEQAHLDVLAPDLSETSLASVIADNITDGRFFVTDDAFINPIENTITGGAGDDRLSGSFITNDLIFGDAGNDRIEGRAGDDYLLGGLGDDSIRGKFGDDVLLGGDGDDTLKGNFGEDRLLGGDGDDYLLGGVGNDLIKGVGSQLGANDFDKIRGGIGSDTIILGEKGSVFYEGDGFATLILFNKNKDVVELVGEASDYLLVTGSGFKTTDLFLDADGSGALSDADDLIAVFQNKRISDFSKGFEFVS